MTRYSKFNIVYWLQKWMDSVPGQTFLNYAYSWGASIVILGTLFKLTHIEGANLMLFIGMGTEVFVFFISAFDRPFDKTTDGMDLQTHYAPPPAPGVADNSDKTEESDLEDEESDGIILGGSDETEEQQQGQAAAAYGGGGGFIIGGGGVPVGEGGGGGGGTAAFDCAFFNSKFSARVTCSSFFNCCISRSERATSACCCFESTSFFSPRSI